jgi:uracil-DNA glycosylase
MCSASNIVEELKRCVLCQDLPLGPKPIFQFHPNAKILIAGQAPGRTTHHKGIPFDDPSGERLRDWMGISRQTFYDKTSIAILPMAFCYPGTGKNGDLPPPSQCALEWRKKLLNLMPDIEFTLVIGKFALDWHLPEERAYSLTSTVKRWKDFWPETLPLPHPSPRNNRWLKNNPWFSDDVLPELKHRVSYLL